MSIHALPRARFSPALLASHPAIRVGAFAALCALGAQVRVYMPGNPAPMTMQTFVVALACLCLPWRQAAAAMGLYVGAGLAGLPVFADAAAGGGALTGATGGYLAGFVLAPLAVALLVRGRPTSFAGSLAIALVAHASVFACGVPWLKLATGSTWAEALLLGLAPFVAGTLAKSALAASIARRPSRA
jgi:biotin transport system substrate-specific component